MKAEVDLVSLEAATQTYWKNSQHLRRGLQTETDKQAFLNFAVKVTVDTTKSADERRLLGRLLNDSK
jgi:hypothetical protein